MSNVRPTLEQFGITESDLKFCQEIDTKEKEYKKSLYTLGNRIFFIFLITLSIISFCLYGFRSGLFSIFLFFIPFYFVMIIILKIGETMITKYVRSLFHPEIIEKIRLMNAIKIKYDKYLIEEKEYLRTLGEENKTREIERRRKEQEEYQAKLNLLRFNREYWTNLSGLEFEGEVAELFKRCGFTAVKVTPPSGDFGVDIIMKKDNLNYVVQCKNWADPIPPSEVIQLFGAFHSAKVDKAIFVGSGGFSANSIQWARNKPIEFIDSEKLIEMQETNQYIPYTSNSIWNTERKKQWRLKK